MIYRLGVRPSADDRPRYLWLPILTPKLLVPASEAASLIPNVSHHRRNKTKNRTRYLPVDCSGMLC